MLTWACPSWSLIFRVETWASSRKLATVLRRVARQVSCSHEVVRTVVRRESKRPVRSDPWQPGRGRLTLADREEISLGLRERASFTAIASRLGKAVSTVSREVARNGGRAGYRDWQAHQQARERARRPKTAKLSRPRLATQVTRWLKEWWSPQEIAGRLRIEYPGDPMMQVSHETIYQALFVQGRGSCVGNWLAAYEPVGSSGGLDGARRAPAKSATWS